MTDFYKNNDDQIRDKLTEHEFSQISGAWENMSKLLDQQQTVPKAASAWWWSLPLVAAAVLTGIISVGVYLNKDQTTTQIALTTQEQDEKSETTVVEELRQIASNNTNSQPVSNEVANSKEQNSNLLATNNANNDIVANETSANTTTNSTKKASQKGANKGRTNSKQNNSIASSRQKTTASSNTNSNEELNTSNGKEQNDVLTKNDQLVDNQAVEDAVDNAEGNKSNKKVKTTKTIVLYQYSTTPLMELQAKRKPIKEPEPTIGNFGINEEWTTRRNPVKIGVFAGASAKMYGSTKKMSVMPTAGITATYKVAPRHAIQAGLQYKAMGQLPSTSSNNETAALNYYTGQNSYKSHSITRIDMLEIPLIYQFYAHQKFNVQAGLKASWLFNTETTNPDFNNMTNDELGVSNFDFGVLVGLEYLFNKHLSLALQYNVGFLNLTAAGQIKQEQAMQQDAMIGVDSQEKANALSTSGEIIVPVSSDATHQEILRLPSNLHNNDIQLLLKYTF